MITTCLVLIGHDVSCHQTVRFSPGKSGVPAEPKKVPRGLLAAGDILGRTLVETVTTQRIEAVASIRLASAMVTVGSISSSTVSPAVRLITFEMIRSRPSALVTTRIS